MARATATRSSIALGIAALALAAPLLVAQPAHGAGPLDERRIHSSAVGSLEYRLHVPAAASAMPLLVYLHGCNAPPSVPGLDDLADAHGFAVAYPIESTAPGGDGCWNWTTDRRRDQGQPALIAGLTRDVIGAEAIEASRVYVVGHSAGSGMTANLAAAYPDLFSAAGLIAGCGRLSCLDITGLSARAEMGARARAVPAYVLWGTQDTTNPYLTGRLQLLQWLSMNDLADDDLPNLSVPRLPTSVERHAAIGGTPAYTVERYAGRNGGEVQFVSVNGMGHVPDATWQPAFPAMVEFLLGTPPR